MHTAHVQKQNICTSIQSHIRLSKRVKRNIQQFKYKIKLTNSLIAN